VVGGLAGTDLPDWPQVWIYGDCHVGELDPVADTVGSPASHGPKTQDYREAI
jgi:uncharacterized protein (DUF2252 family)